MNSKLKNAERMLQVPALLNEHGFTTEIPNNYLVCCSYFYLSLVRKLQRDEWQVAIHFLQAITASPILVHKEFAPMLSTNIYVSCIASAASAEESKAYPYIPQLQDQMIALANLDEFIAGDTTKTSNIKCLRDMLKESQSNTTISSDSRNSDFVEEDDFEESVDGDDCETSLGLERINSGDPQREISDQFSS